MRNCAVPALAVVVSLAALPAVSGYSKKKKVIAETSEFLKQIPEDQKILQALNRLTFGPRPGDAQAVKAMGLKQWIDQQLRPESIPENPLLTEKLRTMDTLQMSSAEMLRRYPSQQLIQQMARGQVPLPSDPDQQLMLKRMIERYNKRMAAGQDPNAPTAPPPGGRDVPGLISLVSPEEARALRQGTPQQRIDAFLALPREKQDEVIEAMPAGMRQNLFNTAPPELRRRLAMAAGPQQVVQRDLLEGKILHAIYGNRQLEEVLTDFWFNHFNVFLDKGADRYLVTQYEREAIRPHVLGKFRDLLEATAKSPAMLFYLDNWQSVGPNAPQGRGPQAPRGLNENYGRELLELHTLGVDGGYTQKDVTEAARCFTGWSIFQPQRVGGFVFNRRAHDDSEKMVLGVKIPAGGGIEDGEKVLDIVARHPATAHFISKKLAMRFVADEPPDALVERMAQTFLKTDGDIRAVLRTMIESKEFFSAGAYQSKLKSPLEVVASAARALNADIDFAFPLANQVAQLGQPLYRKQEPTGYSNNSKDWLNSAGLMARMNFALQLADNKVPGVKVDSTKAAKPDDPIAGIALGSPEFQKR
jgi:uncharacterized protein (DUF1800 family)